MATNCSLLEGSVSYKQADSDITKSIRSVATGDHQEDLIDTIRAERCRLLKRIPKASRTLAADKLATVLARIIAKSDDMLAWEDLLHFCYACFAVPGGRAGKRHHQSPTAKVNNALNVFRHFPHRPQMNHAAANKKQESDGQRRQLRCKDL